MLNNLITVQNWYPTTQYQWSDVIQGINVAGTSNPTTSPYFSTLPTTCNGSVFNVGNNPSGQFIYAVTQYSRYRDLASVNVVYTGSAPTFNRGSLYSFTGITGDAFINATGMVLNVQPNGGSNIVLQFVNPGPDINQVNVFGNGALNCPEPTWTTGFMWSPSYASPWDIRNNVITAQFEPSYQQRQPQGITANASMWTLAFNDVTDAQSKGIAAFIQNVGGVYATTIMMPAYTLYNNPFIKYTLSAFKNNPKSYNINDVSVAAQQVFER